MLLIRFFLILGLLMHPFCGHCLAELRSASGQAEAVADSVDILLDSENDAYAKQTVCTKSPCVSPAKIDLKPSTCLIGTMRPISTATVLNSSARDLVDSLANHSLPLYLQLSVIRN